MQSDKEAEYAIFNAWREANHPGRKFFCEDCEPYQPKEKIEEYKIREARYFDYVEKEIERIEGKPLSELPNFIIARGNVGLVPCVCKVVLLNVVANINAQEREPYIYTPLEELD